MPRNARIRITASELQDGPACADLDVVAMGSQAKYAEFPVGQGTEIQPDHPRVLLGTVRPDFPWPLATAVHTVEHDLVLERIHCGPEAGVLHRAQSTLGH